MGDSITVGLLRARAPSQRVRTFSTAAHLRIFVANNASLANMFAARFKLRLHQHNDLTSRRDPPAMQEMQHR